MEESMVRGFVCLSDAKIHYEIHGAGPPLILLHGNGETMRLFDHMTRQLAKRYRVILFDTRGHGRSDRGVKNLDFNTISADIDAVMDGLDISRAHVLGYSDGGNAAMYLALRFPSRVDRLVLLGANMSPSGIKLGCQIPIAAGYYLLRALARLDSRQALKRDVVGLMVKHPGLMAAELGGIRARTLVAAGERDLVKRAHTREMAEAIPGSRLEILPGLDHFQLVQSLRTWSLVTEFLGGGSDGA